ncbi:hypothetical protein [Gemmobacter denitrificans]|uniref:Uncharacterized protein n=1 Tax=Gemmobacter denitrificans TaxID=3123040 RepID=A0ABU8BS26_9RHOB
MIRREACDLRHQFRNALILAPLVFAALYWLAWPHIAPPVKTEQSERE